MLISGIKNALHKTILKHTRNKNDVGIIKKGKNFTWGSRVMPGIP